MGKCCWRILLTATALIAGTLAGCADLSGPEEATPTPIPTPIVPSRPVYRVERGPIAEEIRFSGRIAAVHEEQLFFRVDGRVARVNVQQGDKVQKGALLAELEISDLLNQLAQAQVNMEQAQLRLRNAEQVSGERQAEAEIALEVARLRLAQAGAQDPALSVTIAAANREKAAAAVQAAQAAYDRRGALPGVAGSPEALNLQRATLDYEVADAQYQLARQGHRSREFDLRIIEQSVRLAELNLKKIAGPVDPVLAQEVARAQLALDRLNAQVANARIESPIAGEVTMVGVYAGRTIAAFRPAIQVAALGALEVSADLMSDVMQELSIGQECTISLVNHPGQELRGTIRRLPHPFGTGGTAVAAAVEEDRSTRVSIEGAEGLTLEKGALVRVTVTLQEKDDVLWLPPAAIRTFSGREFVLVLEGEGQRRVPVRLGIESEDRVEIVEGLSEGQVVIGP